MNPRSPNSDLRSPAKLVRWPFLVGFAAALCIAAVSPTLPPTRIIAGTGMTVVTNGVNNFTLSSSGGISALNQNQFDSTSTNIKSSPLITNGVFQSSGTTNWSFRAKGTNGTTEVYVDKDGLFYLPSTSYPTLSLNIGPSGALTYGSGVLWLCSGLVGPIIQNSGLGVTSSMEIWWSAGTDPQNSQQDTSMRRNAANTVEFDSGTTGVANRGTILAAKYTARAGTSTSTYNAAGLIISDTTQTGNVGTGVDTLQTNSIAANTLAANGDTLVVEADGTFANTGNSKQLILNFGTTAIMTLPTSTYGFGAASTWRIRAKIVRTGAATQKASAEIILNNNEAAIPYTFYTTPTNTLSGAVALWLTGEAVDNNDIVKEMYSVEFKPAP